MLHELSRDALCLEMGDFRTGKNKHYARSLIYLASAISSCFQVQETMLVDLQSPDDIRIWVLDWELKTSSGDGIIDLAIFLGEGRCVQEYWNKVQGQAYCQALPKAKRAQQV